MKIWCHRSIPRPLIYRDLDPAWTTEGVELETDDGVDKIVELVETTVEKFSFDLFLEFVCLAWFDSHI